MKLTGLKQAISILLVLCMVFPVLPIECLGRGVALAEEAARTPAGKFDWALDEAAARLRAQEEPKAEGEWLYYVLEEKNYAVIVGHTDASARSLTVPQLLGGADVMALAEGALADHRALEALALPGNVNAIAARAVPRGTTIKGYNASFAQKYALKEGYPFETRSTFEFRSGAVDYADIRVGNFERVSQHEMILRELEAARLEPGVCFFLVDPNDAYQVSYYQVESMEQADGGRVRVRCSTPEVGKIFTHISASNQEMELDMSTFHFAEGVTVLNQGQTMPRGRKDEVETNALPTLTLDTPMGAKLTLDMSLNYVTSYDVITDEDGNEIVDEKSRVTVTETRGGRLSLECNGGIDREGSQKDKIEAARDLAMAYKAGVYSDGSLENVPVGAGFVFSWGGIVTVEASVSVCYKLELTGKIEVGYEIKNVVERENGKLTKHTYSDQPIAHVQAAVAGCVKAGGMMMVYIGPVGVFSVAAFAGVEGEASSGSIWDYDRIFAEGLDPTKQTTSPNMHDCLNASITFFVEVKASVGILKLLWKDLMSLKWNKTWTYRPFEWKVFDSHVHLCSNPFVYNSEEKKLYTDEGADKDQFHAADACPYSRDSVSFYRKTPGSGWFVMGEYPQAEKGMPVAPYQDMVLAANEEFVGWYTDEACSETALAQWPHVVTDENDKLYAKVLYSNPVSFYTADGELIEPPKTYQTGEQIAFPAVEGLEDWYLLQGVGSMDIEEEVLPGEDGSYAWTMGEVPLAFMAVCKGDLTVEYRRVVNDEARDSATRFARVGSSVEAYRWWNDGRFKSLYWKNEAGEEIAFPYVIPADAQDRVVLTHYLLDDGTGGDGGDDPDDGQTGDLGSPDSRQSSYYYTKTSDTTCTVTGYNGNRESIDANGHRVTWYEDPVNLAIPYSITHKEKDAEGKDVVYHLSVTAIASDAFSGLKTLKAIDIPSSVKTIGSDAFWDNPLLCEVGLPSGLKDIPFRMLCHTPSLRTIWLPDSLESIGEHAFGSSGLRSIKLSGNVKSIGFCAFAYSKSLTEVTLEEGISSIGNSAFSDCTALSKLVLPKSLESIGYSAFNNSGLESLKTAGNLKSIGEYAFEGNQRLAEVELDGTDVAIGGGAFQNTGLRSVKLSGNVKSIGNYAFGDNKSLTEVTLEEGISSIESGAFSGCTALARLAFPDSVTEYGTGIIAGATGLKELTIGGGFASPKTAGDSNTMFNIGNGATLERLIIREGVKSLGSYVFANSYGRGYPTLKSVSLPKSLESIGDSAFKNSGLESLKTAGNLKSIGAYAFEGNRRLAEVELDGTDVAIGGGAFKNTGLRSVKLSGNVKSIGNYAFGDNKSLTEVTLKEGISSIGSYAFSGCTALKSVGISEGVSSIGDYAFCDCPALAKLAFPDSVTAYGYGIIEGATGLKELTIGGGVASLDSGYENRRFTIGRGATLERLIIREGVKYVGPYVFANRQQNISRSYPTLKSVILPESLTCIDSYNLAYWTGTPTVFMGNPEATIGDRGAMPGVTFISEAYNYSLASHARARKATYIALDTDSYLPKQSVVFALKLPAGASMTGLQDGGAWGLDPAYQVYAIVKQVPGGRIALPEAPAIEGYRFTGWYLDEDLHQPLTIERAANDTLIVYAGLEQTSVGGSGFVTEDGVVIDRFLLTEMDGRTIRVPDRMDGQPVVGIANYAFDGLDVREIILPASVTWADEYAFDGASELQSITVDTANRAFSSSNGILYNKDRTVLVRSPEGNSARSVNLPGSVAVISPSAFRNCRSLTSFTAAEGLTEIGARAFSGCSELESVELPESCQTLGEDAFQGCPRVQSFRAMGLAQIGAGALPVSYLTVFKGPFGDCALRRAVQETYGSLRNYNTYLLHVMLNGSERLTVICEAGMPLPRQATYGTLEDGKVFRWLYRDSALTSLWNNETDLMPEQELTLYTSALPLYSTQDVTLALSEEESLSGLRLTAYNGRDKELMLPRSIDGKPVVSIGAQFAASFQKPASVLDIGAGVVEIEEGALDGFEGEIRADEGTYAAQWAAEHGFTAQRSIYTLSFESNGGSVIQKKQMTGDTPVRLPVPTMDHAAFGGWYLDEALTRSVALDEDGLFLMPKSDTTLYAAWTPEAGFETYEQLFDWKQEDGGVIITGYHGTQSAAEIPETINGVPVTGIGYAAFRDNKILESIVLPDTDIAIDSYAFAESALVSANLGGATRIGTGAFSGCAHLAQIQMGAVREIGTDALRDCVSLTQAELPETLVSVGECAFYHTGLEALVMPDGLQTIGENAFAACASLRSVRVGDGVAGLGGRIFRGDTAIERFEASGNGAWIASGGVLYTDGGATLVAYPAAKGGSFATPENVTAIGAYAFEGAAITGIELPAGLQSLGEGAFYGCKKLTALRLDRQDGAQLTIPKNLCTGDEALTEVVLGKGVAAVENDAFSFCGALTDVTIDPNVSLIQDNAFSVTSSRMTITGQKGSAAEFWALDHGVAFTDPDDIEVQSMELRGEQSMMLGTTQKLALSILPEEAAADAALTWSSTDESIVHVDDEGVVTALGRGEATIGVRTPNRVKASIRITVTGTPAQEVEIVGPDRVAVGYSAQLGLVLTPEWSSAEGVVWESADPQCAIVDENGLVTATGVGRTTIRATAFGGRSAEAEIETFVAVESILIEGGEIVGEEGIPRFTMLRGDSFDLGTVIRFDPEEPTNKSLTYASAQTSVAQVDAQGIVKGVAEGSAVLTIASTQTHDGHTSETKLQMDVVTKNIADFAQITCGELVYSGLEQTPEVRVTAGEEELVQDRDYTLKVQPETGVGVYTLTIEGMGHYSGSLTAEWRIVAVEPEFACLGTLILRTGESVRIPYRFLSPDAAGENAMPVSWVNTNQSDAVRSEDEGDLLAVTACEEGEAVYELTGEDGVCLARLEIVVTDQIKSFRLPAALTRIEAGAFCGVAAQELVFSDALETIESGAFETGENCRILNLPDAASFNADALPENAILFCEKDSDVHRKAKEYGVRYVLLP